MKKQKVFLLIILCCLGSLIILNAQSNYDIRLNLNHIDSLNKVAYYDVQLRSTNNTNWGVAGQNYRLFFDASKAIFLQGVSKLPDSYQQFNLVQHVQEVDASATNGAIKFAKTLGFLNFAIDLSDVFNGGITLKEDGNWSTTVQLSFKPKGNTTIDCLAAVWGREGKTGDYATSFVEVSEWVAANNTLAAIGINYFDAKQEKIEPSLWIKIFLQGAYDAASGLMHDSLRRKGYIPLVEPYSKMGERPNTFYARNTVDGLEKIEPIVLANKGENSIVDWVFLELRNKDNPAKIETTRAALLQRNGKIVDVDGGSPVNFLNSPDSFYLSIRHRNHLGIMSKNKLVSTSIGVDFTNPETAVFGNHAMFKNQEVMLLWGGNADSNNFLAFSGGGITLPDTDYIFFDVLTDPANIHFRFNHITKGYYSGDTNMDGEVRYQGIGNDKEELIFYNIILHPENEQYHFNYLIKEQIKR